MTPFPQTTLKKPRINGWQKAKDVWNHIRHPFSFFNNRQESKAFVPNIPERKETEQETGKKEPGDEGERERERQEQRDRERAAREERQERMDRRQADIKQKESEWRKKKQEAEQKMQEKRDQEQNKLKQKEQEWEQKRQDKIKMELANQEQNDRDWQRKRKEEYARERACQEQKQREWERKEQEEEQKRQEENIMKRQREEEKKRVQEQIQLANDARVRWFRKVMLATAVVACVFATVMWRPDDAEERVLDAVIVERALLEKTTLEIKQLAEHDRMIQEMIAWEREEMLNKWLTGGLVALVVVVLFWLR